MQFHFVLVEPGLPENVGAAARAMKTMGFTSLRLVNPCDYLHQRAQWLAHGSVDTLKNAAVFSHLRDAVEDVDFVIGTSAKKRSVKDQNYTGDEILEILKQKEKTILQAAVVFGREDNGLSNQEIRLCDVISSIPLRSVFPSLNLAQAVMIYAYLLSPLALQETIVSHPTKKDADWTKLRGKVTNILARIGMESSTKAHSRIVERVAALGERDMRLLHSLCDKLSERLK
jgi:tRNA/rRNA methyltransferase